MASNFNEVMTMDLKEVRVDKYRYIIYMIDTFTTFTVAAFIRDKKASTIVHNVMLHWVSAGYGRPGKIWTDVGGDGPTDGRGSGDKSRDWSRICSMYEWDE